MSKNIPRAKNYKELTAKDHVSINKENIEVQKNNSLAKDKNGCKMNKRLSLKVKNSLPNPPAQKSFLGETKFKIHYDNEENSRSRPRLRRDILDTTILCRARSLSNTSSNKKVNVNNKLFQRSCSENRKILLQDAQCVGTELQRAQSSKTNLSVEVRKRTFTSIEMWKNKMRKSNTGTIPKNLEAKYPNINVNKTHNKVKQRKSSERTKILPQKSLNKPSEIDRMFKQNSEKIKTSTLSVIQHLPNVEVVSILQDNNLLNAQVNINTSTSNIVKYGKRNDLSNTGFKANLMTSITPLDGSLIPPITPTKVRYLKREVTHGDKLSTKNKDFKDIRRYEYDYLEYVPDVEREREKNTPKLSFNFLKQNVNADQRRIIIGYLIHLGIHYHYSSNIIYQTVKLFDIAVDKILIETDNIQLMALACLWITLKRELTCYKIPSATTIVRMAKDLYIGREKDLLIYEMKITIAVNFNFRFADPFSLLVYYILEITRDKKHNINLNDIPRIYCCGSYLLDISMLNENLCDRPVCVLTIAAAELSLCCIYSDNININTWCELWRHKYSLTEWEEMAMSFTKQTIIRQALESDRFGSNVVYKKYLRSNHGKVSNFLVDKMRKIFISNNR